MTEFGLDVDKLILLRLEVNDLIRCKSVCKSWYSLISSSRFVDSHLHYILKKKKDNNKIGDTRIDALTSTSMCVADCNIMRSHECDVVGSSNGLVCVSRYYNDFVVVNPSTREVKELRHPPQEYHSMSAQRYGFGYDSSIDDYKVVIGFTDRNSKKLVFKVLTLKSNVWRSVAVESDYDHLYGKGILCNGAIHWRSTRKNKLVIVSFDLSKEVFKEIPQPKLDHDDCFLGTMKGRLCILNRPYSKPNSTKIWVMRKYNVQESWEQKLPPPGYDTHKTTMDYFPHKDFMYGNVHIWLLEEGSCGPVLVGSIKRPDWDIRERNSHIRLSTNSECNYNYSDHVFVKSLVSPHGNGSCYEKRVKRKRRRRESPMFHNSERGRAKRTKQSHLSFCSDCDGDGIRRVERKRRERDGGRAKSKRKSLLSCDSDDDGRKVDRKRREKESHVYDSDGDMIVERGRRERESHVYDSDGDMIVERGRRERESYVYDSDGDMIVERGRRERECQVIYDSDDDVIVERRRRKS